MQTQIRKMKCADIEAFIEQGGDVNLQQKHRRIYPPVWATTSLLERAVEKGCPNALRSLIAKGASLQKKSIWDFYVDVKLPRHRERLAPLFLNEEKELDGNCLLFLWSLFFQNVEVSRILYEAFVLPQNEHI